MIDTFDVGVFVIIAIVASLAALCTVNRISASRRLERKLDRIIELLERNP